MEKVY